MNELVKKGDLLFVGEGENALGVLVMDKVEFENDTYLKAMVVPIKFEAIFEQAEKSEEDEFEILRVVVEGETFSIESVENKQLLDALNDKFNKPQAQPGK